MLRKPRHCIIDGVDDRSLRDLGTADHVDFQAKQACGLELGVSGAAACVLREHALDAMLTEQRHVVRPSGTGPRAVTIVACGSSCGGATGSMTRMT